MLHLSSRAAARHAGSSYVCASCRASSNVSLVSAAAAVSPRSVLIPRHNDRLLSTTSRHPAPAVEDQPNISSHGINSSAPLGIPRQKPPSSQFKSTASSRDTTSAPPDLPGPHLPTKVKPKKKATKEAPTKKSEVKTDNERQLHVLQGALAALKNVLAAQNIDVEQINQASGGKKTKRAKGAKNAGGASGEKTSSVAEDDSPPLDIAPALRKAIAAANAAASKVVSDQTEPSGQKASGKNAKKPQTKDSTEARNKAKEERSAKKSPESKTDKTDKNDVNSEPKPTGETKTPYSAIGASPGTEQPDAALKTETLKSTTPKKSQASKKSEASKKSDSSKKSESKKSESSKKPGTSKKTEPSKKKKGAPPKMAISQIRAMYLKLKPIKTERPPVPSLSYGLDRVLFNPGVYVLQDPRSRVFNFDPYLSKIMPLQEFDFNALKQYVTSSKDNTLINIAKQHNKKYTGSTSSMTSMLSHFHYLLSAWRDINTDMLSRSIVPDSVQFTRIQRAPAAIFLHWKDGTYAIDADKEFDTANILSMLGKSMEKLLTLPKEEYERYRHVNSDQITQEEREADEAYHYTGFEDFMMRSQLDAYDPRVPGSGMFDLKTRAVVSIRMDARGFEKGLGYEIRNSIGQWESFEREYYDMMRSAFLKYSLQVRMGRMDGIFVAFHNTQRIFGFQYIPLRDMDHALHGTSNVTLGHREFKLSLSLLNKIFDRATKKWPQQSLRLHFETRSSVGSPFMYVFAKPVTPEDIDEVQNAKKASIEAFEREIMGINRAAPEPEPVVESEEDIANEEEVKVTEPPKNQEDESLAAWEEVRQTVEEAMDDDEVGVGIVREAIEDALEQSGLMRARSSEEAREYVDALLTAITGHVHAKPTVTTENPSEESLGDDEEPVSAADETAAESASDVDAAAEDAATAQSTEAANESSDAVQAAEGNETEEASDHTVDQAVETVSEEPVVASDSQQNSDDISTSSSIEETTESTSEESVVPSDSRDSNDDTLFDVVSVEETVSRVTVKTSYVEASETAQGDEKTVAEEQRDEEDESDDGDVAESKEDSTNASDMSPLKDLIVRMAQRFDKTSTLKDTEDALNDNSKLKSFERILGEIIARERAIESDLTSSQETPAAGEGQPDTASETNTGLGGVATASASGTSSSKGSKASKGKASDDKPEEEDETGEILGMVLTIKNKVNGEYVTRPERLSKEDDWALEYNIEEIPDERARRFYNQCKNRRWKEFADIKDRDTEWYQMFRGKLELHTNKGRAFRAREEARGPNNPVYVAEHNRPLKWEEVFGAVPPAPRPGKVIELDDDDDIDIIDEDGPPAVDESASGEAEAEGTPSVPVADAKENDADAPLSVDEKASGEVEETPSTPVADADAKDIGFVDEDAADEAADKDDKDKSTSDST